MQYSHTTARIRLTRLKVVFMFYETEEEHITTDHLIHQKDGYQIALQLWKDEKRGFLSSSPFGIGAFVRLDDRLQDAPDWVTAPRKPGRDPMGLTATQPNAEFFTTECYDGLKKFADFPEGKQAFAIVAQLFSPRSRGTVTIKSSDPMQLPTVNHNYLADPLDTLVLAEACRFANEIITKGAGTAKIVKGSWPPEATHHTYATRDAWAEYARDNATTGTYLLSTSPRSLCTSSS
jgi:choline dehydrogenase-like flavoprotein